MLDLDKTIATSGKTLHFEKFALRPHLIVLYPQTQFKQIPLEKGTFVLGRGQDADIKLEDELISRRHCSLTFNGNSVRINDLGSTNGTYIDGQPVQSGTLEPDNRLQIGKMVLKLDYKDHNEEVFDQELFEAATMDPLTKISNRRTFFDRALGELALARRNNFYVHSLMIDVDHFKNVNDTWGHQAGDMVLKEIARLIKNEKRESDLLARYGGEEFVMLLTSIGTEDAKKSAERFRLAIERHNFSWRDTIIPVTISIGLSSKMGAEIPTTEEMIAESDKLLYIAKENGRNQVVS